jgi:iron complex outermembrane receptor protein
VGIAVEPIKNLSLTLDYWGIGMTDVLGAVTLAEVQQNPAKYADLIIRNSQGLIDHIVTSQANRGDARMRGLDLSASYRTPTWAFGRFDAKLDGTWYQKYEFQAEKNGAWLQNIAIITNDGRYGGAGPNANLAGLPQLNPRWKHVLSVTWHYGTAWHTTLSQRYNTGFTDQTPRTGSTITKTPALSMFNTNLRYTGIKDTTLSVGVNNMFNKWPPITADSTYNGYITSMADVMGRTFRISAEHKF